jgi:hypothetical protein
MAQIKPGELADLAVALKKRYYHNPYAFIREMFRSKPEPSPHQLQLIRALGRGDRKISIRSGRGTGKSSSVAWLAIWFLLHRPSVKILITAPSSAQLFDALFAEIRRWIEDLEPIYKDCLEVKSDRVEVKAAPAECFITLRTARKESPESLQGLHAPFMLTIVDEASGVEENIFEAISGSMAGDNRHVVLLSNPTRTTGMFYDSHHVLRDQWTNLHWSCVDSNRPGMPDYVEEQRRKWGEESNQFRVQVLGEFPLADDDTVIPMYLIEGAMERQIEQPFNEDEVWGLDVAGDGKRSDASVLFKRAGRDSRRGIKKWRNLDPMQLVGRVKQEYDTAPRKPKVIVVDGIGIGAGVASRLRELNLPVISVNVSEAPAITLPGEGGYANLRVELWHKGREYLEKRDCVLPKDDDMLVELAACRYKAPTSSGKVQLELKRDMKERLGRSPDTADAWLLTFAVEAGAAMGLSTKKGASPRRNLPMV